MVLPVVIVVRNTTSATRGHDERRLLSIPYMSLQLLALAFCSFNACIGCVLLLERLSERKHNQDSRISTAGVSPRR